MLSLDILLSYKLIASIATWEIIDWGSMERAWEEEDTGPKARPILVRVSTIGQLLHCPDLNLLPENRIITSILANSKDATIRIRQDGERARARHTSLRRQPGQDLVVLWELHGSPCSSHWSPAHEQTYLLLEHACLSSGFLPRHTASPIWHWTPHTCYIPSTVSSPGEPALHIAPKSHPT